MLNEPDHHKIIREKWAKPKSVSEKVQQLKIFLLTWATTQRFTSPSTTAEDIAEALELAAKDLRENSGNDRKNTFH